MDEKTPIQEQAFKKYPDTDGIPFETTTKVLGSMLREAFIAGASSTGQGASIDVRGVRPVVQWFAEQMEAKLKANDHKTGWLKDEPESLLKRLNHERKELANAIAWRAVDVGRSADEGVKFIDVSNEAIIKEAADVANFAMMIADLYGEEIGEKQRSESQPTDIVPKLADKLIDDMGAEQI